MYIRGVRWFAVSCVVLLASATRVEAQPTNDTEIRLAAQAKCAAHDPDCDWVVTFSSLEKASIERVRAALRFEVDPSPWGKVIGHIRVYNEPVFAEDNWLQFFNIFHVTTAKSKIRGELTIDEGEVWDQARVEESARRLKDPLYTGVIAILPIKSAEEGKVDMIVITRDIWSLRLNTQYQFQQDTLTNFSISISENNFLGRRMTVAVALLMDLGTIAIGPLFIDKNFLGQHLDFRFRVDKLLTRQRLDIVGYDANMNVIRMPTTDPGGLLDTGKLNSDGEDATVSLTRPLWSLASEWGGGGSFTWRNAVNRTFFGTGLRAVDDPTTPTNEFLPREYRIKTWTARASVLRQWGNEYKHQVELGHIVTSQTPSLLPNFPADPALRDFFIGAVFPRDELISSPFIEYSFFRAAFHTIRNVDTYELAEDVREGPYATVGIQESLKFLGSDFYFTRPSISGGWTFLLGDDSYLRLSAGGQMRIQHETCIAGTTETECSTIDNTATAGFRFVSPTLSILRLVAQAGVDTRWHDTQNADYAVGSDSGLRGYDISQFYGDRRALGQIEARTIPVRGPWIISFLRFGAVMFYEAGGSANSFKEMALYHDIGVGARMLIPQTSRDLFRFDLAFPLAPAGDVRAGFPRFTAGFESYF